VRVVSCAASGTATHNVASARHRRTTIMVGTVGDRVDDGTDAARRALRSSAV